MRSSARMPVGYIRDRTALYKEKWDALHPNAGAAQYAAAERLGRAFGGDNTALLSGDSAGPSDAVTLEMAAVHQNQLMEAEQAINAELSSARAALAQLSRLQISAQEDLFGNNKGQAEKVEAQRGRLRDMVRRIHLLIVDLPSHADAATAQVAERVKRAKATALQEIATELNRQEIKDLQAKTHKGVPGMDRSSVEAIFNQLAEPTPAYTEQQMQQLTDIQHEYEKRDEAIAAMIKEVTEIQEIMRDLNVLVIEQGSMIDRIDQNIEAAAEHIERGVEHVRRAHETSKKSIMTTCIFALLVMIVCVFVLMIIIKS